MLPDMQVWLAHFEYHGQRPRSIPQDVSNVLSDEEHRAIAESLARLQADKAYANETPEQAPDESVKSDELAALTRILQLQNQEDRHHAGLLRDFMMSHGMLLRSATGWRRAADLLRSLVGAESRIALRLAEQLIGQVQYRALESATRCQHLRLLCRMLVADELSHAAFHAELLLASQAQNPPLSRAVSQLAHRAFFIGAACAAWQRHRELLRMSGFGLGTFVRACLSQYSFYLEPHAPPASMPA
jgi:hypothetical protein